MADADYYRQQSEFCAHMAEQIRDPGDQSRRLKLERIARSRLRHYMNWLAGFLRAWRGNLITPIRVRRIFT
jgi:hypothetical protein